MFALAELFLGKLIPKAAGDPLSLCIYSSNPVLVYSEYLSPSRQYLLLGLSPSVRFRGSLLSVIAKSCVERGAVGFIHVGESATLHEQLMDQVLSPVDFAVEPSEFWRNSSFLWKVHQASLDNINIAEFKMAGVHYSAATVLDLPITDQQILLRNGVTTIDDTLSYLATAIASLDKSADFVFGAISQVTAHISYDLESQLTNVIQKSSNSEHLKTLVQYLGSEEFNLRTTDEYLSALKRQHPWYMHHDHFEKSREYRRSK